MNPLHGHPEPDLARPLQPSAVPTNAAAAYADIKRRILTNEYAAGATVPIAQVASLLGISRTPIRDALIRLEKEGLVELVPRYGFRVLPLSARDMLEIYQVLAGLESAAIHVLAERGLDASEVRRLTAPVEAMERALADDDLDAWAAADMTFHRTLIDLVGNTRLSQTVDQFREQTLRARLLTLRLRRRPAASTTNHRKLAEALIAGDARAAYEAHMSQRARSGTELVDILSRLNIRQL
jgi:DNA-binding GntR family transcriptional regulator